MSLLKSLISVCLLTLALGCIGCQDKGGGGQPTPTPTPKLSPTPTPPCKPLEKPCAGEGPLVSHAYSECCDDGFWHVVQFDAYKCPELKWFRVAPDTPTLQRCKEGAGPVGAAPKPVDTGYKDFHNDPSCQSPKDTKRIITISVCENGFWVNEFYRVYECLDKSLRITKPPDSVQKTGTKCTDPPPPPTVP
jgi:hypothetical protein